MLERKSLKSQFVITFFFIILASILCTIATYFAGYAIYINIEYKNMYPANYYEKQIPAIETYVRKKGARIVNREEKQSMDRMIPAKGILYEVMDENGKRVYGTDDKQILQGKTQLLHTINTTIGIDGRYVRIIPIFNSHDKIRGAVSLSYILTPHYASTFDKMWIVPVLIGIVLSPFVYIAVFTLLFSKRIADTIGRPVNMLIDAAKKVKEKDLDFQIDYDADNELGKLCEAFTDMKKELKESLLSQWKAEQNRREMVHALAHDLKTPFSIILGYVEALLEGNHRDAEKTEKYLKVIQDNANKGSVLVKEMLFAAELEASGADLHATPVDMDSFLLQKTESYEMLAKHKQIHFKVDVTYENRDATICSVDAVKLERILDNIILNSIRYTPNFGMITIHADVAFDRIHFQICDTGKGFSNKDLSNLFDKFYRGDESRSSKNGHAGLGLYIAKKLVEMHGGTILAYNTQDGGACMEFALFF
ncbi:HAMP domain-containing histidine kinase [Fodinisporobacter ferrooxydans]|uniref:histidine kinase n=1 Tax=Fodinisporobacter ferrooxydans TaxID=2901836 RepID=A0ABY4CLG9_9BACL|nr:HAMP domain-containing histidine kinase [Alicyclobacillaceae bacterium MYW30-H2]